MNGATVRTFSDYQISVLRNMILRETIIERLARVDESGDMIIGYRGGLDNYDGISQTKAVPYRPNDTKSQTEDADFEIIQPKQIENS